jgi:hypothetical protein
MAGKKQTFAEIELEWAEKQLKEWKAYIDNNPLHTLADRIEWKPTAKGGTIPMVIASIEQQGKFVQDTLKNYLALLKEVEQMREAEAKKVEVRGKAELSTQAEQWLKDRRL